MSAAEWRDWLVTLRRDLHRLPEPAWREFYTTQRIREAIESLSLPDCTVRVGEAALDTDARLGVPDEATLTEWRDRAAAAGVAADRLEAMAGGRTGLLATLERGEGPTVALRVDIDALPRRESTDADHRPAAEGFRAVYDDAMHACGHDAHAAIGAGVLRAVADSDFAGTLKVVFQPAEEVVGGGRAVAESGHLDDVDALLAVHVGLDHPTGEVVAGMSGILAVRQFRADFTGESAHAGKHPNQGQDAVQAMAAAATTLPGIPRHEEGATRVNAGRVGGGTATNIVPESAFLEGEVRGETTPLRDYTWDRARDVLRGAAAMHGCSVAVETLGEAPSAESDRDLADAVETAAGAVEGVERVRPTAPLGGSEDATYLMRRVQERGGRATYVCIGTDHPGGHHTATFDVDEDSLVIGVDALTAAIRHIAAES